MTTKTNIEAVNSGQTEREALLPCPFCGDKAEYKHNSLHGDESMAVCRCCGAQAFWSKWQARALLASKSAARDACQIDNFSSRVCQYGTRSCVSEHTAPASPSGEDAAEQSAATMACQHSWLPYYEGVELCNWCKATRAVPRAAEQADEAVTELQNIVNAKRFDRDTFANDTEFADWVQSRARHTLGRAKEPK